MTTAMGASLGGASFQVTADATKFQAALKDAKAASLQTSQRIAGDLAGAGQAATTHFDVMGRNADKASKGLGKVNDQLKSKNSTHFALGLMAVGNAADDLQYGFRSIVNNIPQMVYLFGGNAGLAGGAAIAAVAINQLMQHWDQLGDAMKGGWLNVGAKDLELVRIRAEKAAEAFGKLKLEMAPQQIEAANLWKKAIVEAPGGLEKFTEGVRGAILGTPGIRPEETGAEKTERTELKKRLENAQGGGVNMANIRRNIEARLKQMDDALTTALDKKVEEFVGGVMIAGKQGDQYRKLAGEMLNRFPQLFTAEAKRHGGMAEPGRVERRLKNERDQESEMRRIQEEEASNKAAAGKMASGPLGTAILYGADKEGAKGPPKITQKDVIARARKLYEAEEAKRKAEGRGSLGAFGDAGIIPKFAPTARQQLRDEQAKLPEAATDLEKAAKEMMRNAGVAGDPKGVIAETRKLLEDRRSDIMARTGATREQAEAIMKREQMQAGQGAMGPPAQRMGLVEFSHFTQGGILNSNIPAQQLEQLRKMNVTLDMLAKRDNKAQPAVAGK